MTARRRGAFTLLEVMAVVLLTSVVIGVALNHYVNLSRATRRAGEHTNDVRRATAILDRIARDFEGTVFIVKQPEQDPLEHPWIFLGESRRSDLGADHLKFVTRGRQPSRTAGHQSDLEVVAYALRRSEGDLFELLRWSSPQLPESYDDAVPSDESEGALLFAEDLAGFGVRFTDALGSQSSIWNASQLLDSGELPASVEIQVAMLDPDAGPGSEPLIYRRKVILPVGPLDMQELLDPSSLASGGAGEEEDETGEGGEEDGDLRRAKAEDQDCLASPCANMSTCSVINCRANLGQHTVSIDIMLNDEIENPRSYCSWRFSMGNQRNIVARLVPNAACR